MSFKGRQQANLEIIEALREFFEAHPEQRFHQGLMNLGLLNRIQRHLGGQTFDYFYADEAHTESTVALNRVYNAKEYLDGQRSSN